jgi:hypothetical protein
MSAHELAEHIEHAGHEHKKGGPQKAIGVTMALLGVMLAVCAAMVGSSRTDLIRNTVEQSNQYAEFQAESTKYHMMEADYEMLHALTPSKAELKKFEDRLAAVHANSGKGDDEDTAEIKETVNVSTHELADVLTPDKEDEDRIKSLALRYKHDMAEAKEDAEAYDLAIEAHHEAAEGYEHAQLCAEVGIVVASIALLMSSRIVWSISLLIGLVGAGFIGKTAYQTQSQLAAAEKKIKDAATHQADIAKEDEGDEGKGEPAKPEKEEAKEPPKQENKEGAAAIGAGDAGAKADAAKDGGKESAKPAPKKGGAKQE